MCYRFTHDRRYLDRAVKSAEYFINHPNLPEDKVPHWDYYAPGFPTSCATLRRRPSPPRRSRTGQVRPRKGKALLQDGRKDPALARFDRYLIPRGGEERIPDRPQRRFETQQIAGRCADHLRRLLFPRSAARAEKLQIP